MPCSVCPVERIIRVQFFKTQLVCVSIPKWRIVAGVREVHRHGLPNLPQTASTTGRLGLCPAACKNRHEERGQNADDGNHDEQFQQRECASWRKNSGLLRCSIFNFIFRLRVLLNRSFYGGGFFSHVWKLKWAQRLVK